MSDAAETLWDGYPHSLYQFRDATGCIRATPGHASSATIRAISLEEIRLYIIDAISSSPRLRNAREYGVQRTLNALMRTCSSFFGLAASALWRNLDEIEVLWSVLIKNGAFTSGVIQPLEMQRYILCTYGNLEGHLRDRNFGHLAYYASFVQELTTSSAVIRGELILLLSHLLPDGRHLFPRLERLYWHNSHSPVGGLQARSFNLVRGPRTSSIELFIPSTISPFRCWVNEALLMLSNSPSPLTDIHIIASSPFSQSAQQATSLQRHLVDLFTKAPAIVLCDDDINDKGAKQTRSAAYVKALQRCWGTHVGGTACISVVDAPRTALDAARFPSSIDTLSPARYVLQHTHYTIATIDIFCAVNPAWTTAGSQHSGVTILQTVAPLLHLGQLRAANIEFRGQAFSFSRADLAYLLQRWRNLRELCIIYNLTTSDDIPDIADIHRLLDGFPDLRALHVPGLAAHGVSSSPLSLSTSESDAHPNPNLVYLSSSTLVADIPTSPNTIAMALLAMFPKIRGAGLVVDDGGLWREITNNIEFMVELSFETPSPVYMMLYAQPEPST